MRGYAMKLFSRSAESNENRKTFSFLLRRPQKGRTTGGIRTRKIVAFLVIVPPIVLAGMGLSIAFRIYSANRAESEQHYPYMIPPHPPQSLLVFAPHCDDETLGAAGLIRQAEINHCAVHIVVMTNGDGFRVAAEREFNKINLAPSDFVRFGYLRQQETVTALGVLSVPPSDIQFLGYPDRGLMYLWTTNWDIRHPYRSIYTQASHNPYTDVLSPGAPYCGESVLTDVRAMLEKIKPTDIYVTHPDDDHPDHAATSVFVASALSQLRDAGEPWAGRAQIHYYLVHRGDWPVPQGLDEDFPMGPPAPMAALDTRWSELKLSRRDIQRKYAAVRRYKSQTLVTSRFMYSFVKRNELFGTLQDTIPALSIMPNHSIVVGRGAEDWDHVPPLILDPVGDSVLPSLQPGGDIQTVSICRDSANLFILLHMHGKLDQKMAYQVVLRPMADGTSQKSAVILTAGAKPLNLVQPLGGHPGAYVLAGGRDVILSIPLRDPSLASLKGVHNLYLAANTYLDNVRVDKTGFRCARLTPLPSSRPVVAAISSQKKLMLSHDILSGRSARS